MRFETDARFRKPQKKNLKLELDDRFKDVLKNEFYEGAPVDKFGRAGNEDAQFMKKQFDYDLVSDDEKSVQEEMDDDPVIEMDKVLDPEEIELGETSNRLGLVNIDWDNIKAQDIFMLMDSFTKSPGDVLTVHIYESEFGKDRIAHEQLNGPPKEIFNDDDDKENPFNMPELRRYQLERMRYYFCIIVFKDTLACEAVFNACDGQELELTSNSLDLRYVPPGTDFNDSIVHDECLEIPSKYEPLHFETKALQHSNIKLTWDKDEIERQKMVKRLQNGDLENHSQLIASCSESEQDFDVSALKKPESDLEEDVLDIKFQPQFVQSKSQLDMSSSSSDEDIQHFDMRDVARASKANHMSKWKKRKVAKLLKSGKIDKDEANRMTGVINDKFTVDLKDPRFQNMFNDPNYHVDKLDSHFTKTRNSAAILNHSNLDE
eukprot:NODE_94_length_21515_cov_0.130417.p4 type:complete len:433 gc:universal NODE_94_length_21515_cov_0.130417:14906-16204(+)